MTTPHIPPKVLVTGASGFIGLHTVLHLLQCGYRVRATVRTEGCWLPRSGLAFDGFRIVPGHTPKGNDRLRLTN